MSYDSEWFSDPVTQELIKSYYRLRESHLKSLIAAANDSTDPKVQKHASAIVTIDRLVAEIISRKGKTEEEL